MPASASPPFMQPQRNLTNPPPRNVLPPLQAHEEMGPGAPQRPGSGMSISAMLGADTSSSRDGKPADVGFGRAPETNGAGQARPLANLGPPLPQGSPVHAGNGQSHGSISLDRYKSWFPENTRTPHAHSATLPPSPFPSGKPIESPSFGPPLRAASGQSPPRPLGFTESSSPRDHADFITRKYSLSDPNRFHTTRPIGPRISSRDERPSGDQYQPVNRLQSENDLKARLSNESSEQARNIPAYLAPKTMEGNDNKPNDVSHSNRPFLSSGQQPSTDLQRSLSSDGKPESSRILEAPYPRQGNLPTVPAPEPHRHSSETGMAALQSSNEPRQASVPLSESPEQRRNSPLLHLQRQLAASAAGADDGSSSPEQSRKLLSLLNDHKRGRVSPLPQAVQGAQAQLRGPASEPGIKNEFARMFSGIGSGVGSAVSTPVPPDNTHPPRLPSSPSGPDDGERQTPLSRRKELTDEPKQKNSSRAGKRGRKTKDGEVKKELEEASGTGLDRTSSGRGQKRTRNNYQNIGNITQG